MRRLLPLLGLSLCCAAPAYTAPIDFSGGVEYFVWQEYEKDGSRLVKETGPRLFVAVEAENHVSERWTYGFRSRIYSRTVDYDGETLAGTPHSTESSYDGGSVVIDFTGRLPGSEQQHYSDLALRFGFGGEAWRRHILPNGGVSGYKEEYVVVFGKLGFAYVPEGGWMAEAGAKYPLSVDEDVALYDNVTLSPQGSFSLYARLGYNFNQRWSIKAYYDGYRFKRSDPEPLTNNGAPVGNFVQPESTMDTVGVSLGFYF